MKTAAFHIVKLTLVAGLLFAQSCQKLEHTNPFDPQITFTTILEKGYETIHNDMTITPEGNPYHVTTNIQVEATLTIEPGVILKFDAGIGIALSGHGARIIARGNEVGRIDFLPSGSSSWGGLNLAVADSTCVLEHCMIQNGSIAFNDKFLMRHCTVTNSSLTTTGLPSFSASTIALIDSNNIGSNEPSGGYSISLAGKIPVRLTHNTASGLPINISDTCHHEIMNNDFSTAAVMCSGNALAKIWNNKLTSIQCDGASPDIRNNSFKAGNRLSSKGIFLRFSSNPVIKYNFFDSLSIGIWIKSVSSAGTSTLPLNNNPDIQSNNFTPFVVTLVSLDMANGTGEAKQTDPVSAPNNFWGTSDSTQIESKIFDALDDSTVGRVNFMPFRATPVPVDSVGPGW
jgi:hypothetical protein